MGNRIGLPRTGADIYLSNMGTAALLVMLVLSGTAIARTKGEKNLVVFLAERDQTYRGLGVVGFNLNEMPWDRDAFEDQVRFMIRVVDGALARTNWDKVRNFTPSIEQCSRLKVLRACFPIFAWPTSKLASGCPRRSTSYVMITPR